MTKELIVLTLEPKGLGSPALVFQTPSRLFLASSETRPCTRAEETFEGRSARRSRGPPQLLLAPHCIERLKPLANAYYDVDGTKMPCDLVTFEH